MRKLLFIIPVLAVVLSGCLGDNKNDYYSEWKRQNDAYLADLESKTASGTSEYTRIIPDWAPQNSVYVKWHNDRSATAKNLSPLSNSTVDITYAMENINDEALGDSYSSTTWGDSIYRSRPNQNIAGMWIAMLNMHVGDSVTMVIPYTSGYGAREMGKIKPYSNLIYHVKMKAIPKYEY